MNIHANKPQVARGETKLAASPPGGLIDKNAVARLIQFSPRSVDNFIKLGMPHMRFGERRTRFDPVEVLAWCKAKFGTQRFGSLRPVEADEAK